MASEVSSAKCCTEMADTVVTVREWTFNRTTLACLFEELRSIGMEGRYQLPKYEHQRQYVICGVFSREEIESSEKHKQQIEKFRQHLLMIDDKTTDKKFGGKFICKDRIGVLLNNFGRHGEARLFDPDNTLLHQCGIKEETEADSVTERHNFLDGMKQNFLRRFGKRSEQYIVLLSHLIPCTEEGHECARLIREYVELTNDKVIVSYDCGWQGTDRRQAIELLTHENICLVEPRDRRGVVNSEVRSIADRMDCSNILKRINSIENEHVDELDLLEVKTKKRKSDRKWETQRKQHRPADGKKKKRRYSRQNFENEW